MIDYVCVVCPGDHCCKLSQPGGRIKLPIFCAADPGGSKLIRPEWRPIPEKGQFYYAGSFPLTAPEFMGGLQKSV